MRLAAASAALLASASAVDAGFSSGGPATPHVGLVSRLHQNALHHSASLAKDIRIAFRGLLSDPPRKDKKTKLGKRATQKPFCVSRTGNGTSSGSDSGSSAQPSTSGVRPPAASSTPVASGSSQSASGSSTKTASSSASSATPTSAYNLEQSYTGSDFWTKWDFFTNADPTGGTVTYVDASTAQSSGLAYVTSNNSAVMAVDTTAVVTGGRKSVRIQSQYSFNEGLVILDATHMPTGCGTWPAFWTNGPNWPYTGEIDILEGVNDYTENQATIHTTTGCTMNSTSGSTGTLVSVTNCDATATDNQGCGLRDSRTNSYGAGFNSVGGGVYSMLWDDSGVSVWFFQRSKIPSDISSSAPNPDNWGTPMAFWSGESCNPSTFFKDHSAIFDTTLCGDWASGVWSTGNTAGQGDSCATSTGVATCSDYVLNNGAAFAEAFWEVNYVKIFQHK
ncbi:unnamed protein product [Peniophora sp. CBMAI 1063]|nr:unnamed protein product [Peniophora sp. CBMAI 1063]